MSRAFKVAVVLVLLALAPLRGLAGIASSHSLQDGAAAAHAGHGAHEHGKAPQGGGGDRASGCMEHCAGIVLVSPPPLRFLPEPHGNRIAFAARAAPAFFPDPLDPPPLAG